LEQSLLETIGKAAKQQKEAFIKLPLRTKLVILTGLLGGTLVILVLVYAAGTAEYDVLYKGLSKSDAASILEWLKKEKVPYRLEGDNAIEVPVEKIGETRISLAAQGIPSGGGSGFELFDNQGISTTPFVQKVNYQRALQGELARTILSLQEVESARVHLAMPRHRLFEKDRIKPTASVMVTLKPGRRLSSSQVDAIVHLVSSSIVGLAPERVSIVDQRGELLAGPGGLGSEGRKIEDKALALKNKYERQLEVRVREALAKLVGEHGVEVSVSAEIEVSKNEATQEKYDPDSAVVRSEQRVAESHDGTTPQVGGVAGARGNVPGPDGKPQSVKTSMAVSREKGNKERTVLNYEINKTITHTTSTPLNIKRLTVAVLVDKKSLAGQGGKEAGVDRLKEIVKRMVGFEAARGDEIDVMVAPFKAEPAAREIEPSFYRTPWFWKILQYAALLILAAVIFIVMVLPGLRAARHLPSIEVLGKPVAELEASIEGQSGNTIEKAEANGRNAQIPERELAGMYGYQKGEVSNYVTQNTDQAAEVLRTWLSE